MDASIIYFDNAATTFPKPEEVYMSLDMHFRQAGNAGRGAHSLAMQSARTIFDARESIADFLGASRAERLIFTPGCTQSINIALKGFFRQAKLTPESVVLTSALEHNAVTRTLHALKQQSDFRIEKLSYIQGKFCDLRDLADALESLEPALMILTEGSNVTGEIADWFVVADLCKQHGVPLLIDAAQTAGRYPGCLAHDGISFWCASAHKGLMGPQGLGLLYVNPNFDLPAFVDGGTGSQSEQVAMPDSYPDRLEAGTMPAPLIAALWSGIDWLQKIGPLKIQEHEDRLMMRFLRWCEGQRGIRLYGFFKPEPGAHIDYKLDDEKVSARLPIVSFRVAGRSPEQVAEQLEQRAHIAVRSGLHCAAQAHLALGTESTGLVRASFSMFNTTGEIDLFCRTLDHIIAGA